jgi:type II secretory pathway pseudopilin PulG
MRSLWRRTSARDGGFTIVEVTITGGLFMLVLATMLLSFNTIQRTAVRQSSRSETSDAVRLTMDRMTKEIRQATDIIPGSDGDYLEMDTYIGGVEKRIIYDATTPNTLARMEDGDTVTLLERLTVTTVFTYVPETTDPSVITITLTAKPEKFSGDVTTVSLTSEVELRNRSSTS